MNRHSPLLLTILLIMTVLGHSAHGAITSPRSVTSAAPGISTTTIEHTHGPLAQLRVVHHSALDGISPEICTVGEQVAPAPTSGPAQVAMPDHDTRGRASLPVTPSVSTFEAPVWPPDVRRALLQTFLN